MQLKIKNPIKVLTGRSIPEEIKVEDLKLNTVIFGDGGGPGTVSVSVNFVYEDKTRETRHIVIPDKFLDDNKKQIKDFIRLMLNGVSANPQYEGEIIEKNKVNNDPS